MEKGRRVLGEFVLIVLGVLTALAAEEFMSDRRDAALAEEYRTRLQSELTEDSRALQRRAEFFRIVAPDDYRRLVRGIVPLALQDYVRDGCGVADQTGSNDVVRGECPLGVLSIADVRKAVAEIRALPELERSLRQHIAEVESGAFLYGTQRTLAEDALALLQPGA